MIKIHGKLINYGGIMTNLHNVISPNNHSIKDIVYIQLFTIFRLKINPHFGMDSETFLKFGEAMLKYITEYTDNIRER